MKSLFILVIVLLLSNSNFTQNFRNWKNYNDLKQVQFVDSKNGIFWAATSGGAFQYIKSENKFKFITKAEGLSGASITALTIDKYGKIWFGSSDGTIDVYDPSTSLFKRILDITNSGKLTRQINELSLNGDTILVATDFGLTQINSKDYFFYDSYLKFGNLSSNIKVKSVLKKDLFYIGLEQGVAIQKPGTINLSAPESWETYQTINGLSSNNINKLIFYNDTLLAATERGISFFNGTSWGSLIPLISTRNINDIVASSDTLFILSQSLVYSYSNGTTEILIGGDGTIINKIHRGEDNINYYSTNKGLMVFNKINNERIYIAPTSPQSNLFPSIAVDDNGNVWSASGRDITGVGFYKYNGVEWKNFNILNNPSLLSNSFHVVYSSQNNIYLGNWGRGFVSISNDTVINNYYTNETGMTGIPGDPNFLVITGFAKDSRNNLWVLNYGAANRKTLSVLTPQGDWHHYANRTDSLLITNFNIAVDLNDTKWYASYDPRRRGLFYFNENRTFGITTDDRHGYITEGSGLPNSNVNAIAVDRRGDVWVGTSLGATIISNTNLILNSNNPALRFNPVFAIRQQKINAIYVDPLNKKWIGTDQGLFLLSSDGTNLISFLDSRNSPLPTDIIRSITMNENTGTVYIGTDLGLTSFETDAVKPNEEYEELFIYPNPFIINGNTNQITIDGLIRDSEIKILSINGKLINEFSSPGGRIAYWNGKNFEGEFVSTGVYLIIAYDKEGNNVTTSKVAVIKK